MNNKKVNDKRIREKGNIPVLAAPASASPAASAAAAPSPDAALAPRPPAAAEVEAKRFGCWAVGLCWKKADEKAVGLQFGDGECL